MSDGGEERLVAEIPEELKKLVDADQRTNKEVVQAALWREFGGERKAAIDRRIEEKERRVSMIESEKNERQRELEQERQELEALKTKREKVESEKRQQQNELAEVKEKLADAPKDPDNPAIQKYAGELDMTPEELIDELPNSSDGGLSSL